ncbi:MAG: hypothetical protein H0V22_01245 [Solirubrobacterales bacterium]|jgi:sugar (pentulose or hexulose) kinase|nr:hypothetical protein [Solirubrobacterales bacterium]
MTELLLGLDVGTTYCKAVVLEPSGAEVSQARSRTPWTQVATGAELDPEEIVRATLAAAAEALANGPAGVVAAVGVAGMAETGVLLDRHGRPVGPAIAWHDARGADEAAEIAAQFGARAFAERTGLPASALCSASKLRWQLSRLPAAARGVRWLGIPEWVARSLGAAEVAELSLASRTGLFELVAGVWWSEALEWLGVQADFMAEPVQAGVQIGRVGQAFAPGRGAAIAIAGHDHLAAMVGADADREGDVLLSSGTAEVIVRTSPAGLPPGRIADAVAAGVTVGRHVLPDRWALLSGNELCVAQAGVLKALGVEGQTERDALTESVAGLDPAETPPRLAAFGGPRPLTRADLPPEATPASVWRAALEAGADMSARTLSRSNAVAGPHGRIVATGGGGRGAAARAAKEGRLGPIEWSSVQEATARGAALLGGWSVGMAESDASAVGGFS